MKEPAAFHDPVVQHALLARGTREQIIAWLVWNDPNGTYTDRDSESDGMGPLTLSEARRIMRDQISRQ